MRIQAPYNEDYPTCEYTHAWLRVMDESLDPNEITEMLSVEPSYVQFKGDLPKPDSKHPLKKSGWFLSTEDILSSKDSRHHLDWILEKVAGKQKEFSTLHKRGYLIDLCVRWDSKLGHGGPTLTPDEMKIVSELEIELWFDVYVGWEED